MEDYIDALLQFTAEQRMESQSSRYLSALAREEEAAEALLRTLNEEQQTLFRAYENARSDSAMIAEDDYARAAFLLAREIFS